MKQKLKRSAILSCLVVVMLLIAGIVTITSLQSVIPTDAVTSISSSTASPVATTTNVNDLTFTSFTNGNTGQQEYKVAIRTAVRPTVELVIIPDTYNNLPVTQIADNGFTACTKLTKVIMPKSVTMIGTNAFMNCTKLERAAIPKVKTISTNAFALCTSLDKLFIPNTVEEVGAAILRNNANDIYFQGTANDISDWGANWNQYYTGDVTVGANPSDVLEYRAIYDNNNEVTAYEIKEGQVISGDDAIIYSSYSPEVGVVDFKPVININTHAFNFASLDTLTIKHRHEDDPTFPVYNHAINLRSEAFSSSFITEIIINVDLTFYTMPPYDVQYDSEFFSDLDGTSLPVGNGIESKNVFFQSYLLESITLPASLSTISDGMFRDSTSLAAIKIDDIAYQGQNILPSVESIGSYAFSSCVSLENIFVPNTVSTVGEAIFNFIGTGNVYDSQGIYIDIYEDEVLALWASSNWNTGIDFSKTVLTYKPLVNATLDLQDGLGTSITVNGKPGNAMPAITMPTKAGYIFKGFYSQPNGSGLQYYTETLTSARNWDLVNGSTLYAFWTQSAFNVTLNDGENSTTVTAEIGKAMPAASLPTKIGYKFKGYYFLKTDNSRTYYYNADMSSAKSWDIAEDTTLLADWEIEVYNITYNVDLKGNTNSNPTEYTVETIPITFTNLSKVGYDFSWSVASLFGGTTGDITVSGTWTAKKYSINYNVDLKGQTNPNPVQYTVEMLPLTFIDLSKPGYTFAWNPVGLDADIELKDYTIVGLWDLINYNITYQVNGQVVAPILGNPSMYNVESSDINFIEDNERGYSFSWNCTVLSAGSIGNKTIVGTKTLITYSITYKIDGVEVSPNNGNPSSYTVISPTIYIETAFASGFYSIWETTNIPKGSTGNKEINGVWEEQDYKIYYNSNGGNVLPAKDVKYSISINSLSTPVHPEGRGFLGWYLEDSNGSYVHELGGNYTLINANTVYTYTNNITLKASWQYKVTFNSNGGTSVASQFYSYGGIIYPFPSTVKPNSGYRFNVWEDSTTGADYRLLWDSVSSMLFEPDTAGPHMALPVDYIVTDDISFNAQWVEALIIVGVSYYDNNGKSLNNDGTINNGSSVASNDIRVLGYSDAIQLTSIGDLSSGHSFKYYTGFTSIHYNEILVNGKIEAADTIENEIYQYYSATGQYQDVYISPQTFDVTFMMIAIEAVFAKGCVTEDTLITLANGSQKAVADLDGTEMLLVWNLFTGTFDSAPIVFVDSEISRLYEVTHLYFSDGTEVKVISEHGFWNYTLNEYVMLKQDAIKYIGHYFDKMGTAVQLVDVVIETEYTSAWSPVTYGHLCFYVNGMLSLPGNIEGLYNIFEVDADTMSYDLTEMAEDIAEYGLYTYNEFAEIFPISQDIFDAFNVQYFKVAIGKGLLTMEKIESLIETYVQFL